MKHFVQPTVKNAISRLRLTAATLKVFNVMKLAMQTRVRVQHTISDDAPPPNTA